MEALQQLIDKISQYSFLTNILPGAVLMIILKYDYSGLNVPLVAVCNVPPIAFSNVPPQKWLL